MTRVTLNGYFCESDAEAIKEKMTGKSYMNFEIEIGGSGVNRTLIVSTSVEGVTEEGLKNVFYCAALMELAEK